MNPRQDFPFFSKRPELVFLDSAASTQRAKPVLDAMQDFEESHYSNVHRGSSTLSEEATESYEQSREIVATFIGAQPEQLVFTRGTTEGLNFVAQARTYASVLYTELEHNSNVLPWKMRARQTFLMKPTDLTITPDELNEALQEHKPKLVTFTHTSNVTGITNDVKELCKVASDNNVQSVIDFAQGAASSPIDIKKVPCTFLAFSSHKMYGPTGIGALYGADLEAEKPFQFGGGMVDAISENNITFSPSPQKHEAGTPPIVQAVGFAAATTYVKEHQRYIKDNVKGKLAKALTEALHSVPGVSLVAENTFIGSFTTSHHSHDVAYLLGAHNIVARSGHHCAQLLAKRINPTGTVRASLGIYNTQEDIQQLKEALEQTMKKLA
ncbi:MAG: aminotransferase class V-fold PLP-dependent enzyme [Candidatus Woesearchaeota archaeon]|nr:MAG: aminotransferase class V-fold PLP-dependent enzyme [Candidatus Woesearchaeota archaeon]